MWTAQSKVRQTWSGLWAVLALVILTMFAGDRLAARLIPGAAAATPEVTHPAAVSQARRVASATQSTDDF